MGGEVTRNRFDDRRSAIAWARSVGYPVPEELNGCLGFFLVFLGLCIFVLPGLVIVIYVFYRGQRYESETNALVARWIDAGRPEPGIKSNVDNMINTVETTKTITDQLEEYSKMLEQGLISSKEHEALRKNALGL